MSSNFVQNSVTYGVVIAAVITTSFATLPQIIHSMRTSKTEDISYCAIMIGMLSSISWGMYGLLINDNIQIIGNIFLFMNNTFLCYLKYRKKDDEYDLIYKSSKIYTDYP